MQKKNKDDNYIARFRIIICRLIGLCFMFYCWHLTQQAISTYKNTLPTNSCIYDQTFNATTLINQYLNHHSLLSKILLTIITFEIDALTLFIFIYSAFSKSAKLIVGLFILMCLRQFAQLMVLLKYPAGMLWFDTHIPTLFVTYHVYNDFFFSGHTALVVYTALSIGKIFKQYQYISILKWGLMIFQIAGIIVLRAHYFMDIYAAIMTAIVVYQFTFSLKLPYWLDMSGEGQRLQSQF